eukprot:7215350-Alexandrium_andersonii.AAC.1
MRSAPELGITQRSALGMGSEPSRATSRGLVACEPVGGHTLTSQPATNGFGKIGLLARLARGSEV